MKTIRHSHLALFFLCALATAQAWAEPARSSAASSDAVLWRFDGGISSAWVPSWEAERPFLSAMGFGIDTGIEAAWGNWIPIRGDFSFYSVGRSTLDPNLFLYRPFWGWRFALETGGFVAIGKMDLAILAGGAFSAYEYTGTSLVGAYWSALCEIRLQFPFFMRGIKGLKIDVGIPFEYMWRGAAQSYGLGLTIGAGIPLGKGKQ